MKSYARNWQINRNGRNQMSEKILSERIPLNGQWNNRTSPTWPETRREGRSRTSFFFQNWRNQMTEEYRTIGPEIQGFLSDGRSFYRTCPTVFRFLWSCQFKSLLKPGVLNTTLFDIKFVSDLQQGGGFLQALRFLSSVNKTGRHDITEILLKVALTTITPNPWLIMAIRYCWQCFQ